MQLFDDTVLNLEVCTPLHLRFDKGSAACGVVNYETEQCVEAFAEFHCTFSIRN
jgi:hypothetical protein